MGIRICTVDYDGDERAVIACSTTERIVSLPMFRDSEEAMGFLDFAEDLGYTDVRAMSPDSLDRLHTAWLAQRAADAEEKRDASAA